MTHSLRMMLAAAALFVAGLLPMPGQAAMAPGGLSELASAANPAAATEVRWGRRGGWHGGRGWHRPRAIYRPVHFRPRPVYRRAHWGPRPVYRRAYWGTPVYYTPYPRCIRRGWVWNGYRHVWRRYRVC